MTKKNENKWGSEEQDWANELARFQAFGNRERTLPADHSPIGWEYYEEGKLIKTYDSVERADHAKKMFGGVVRPIYAQSPQNAADHIEAQSVPVACKHEFEPLVGPHKECVLCGDVRKDQERKILDGYDDWCKQFIADFGCVPDVLDAFEGGKNNSPQSDAQSVRDVVPQALVDVSDGAWADLHKTQAEKALADVRDILTDSDQSHIAVRVCRALEKIDLILPAPPQKPVSDEVKP